MADEDKIAPEALERARSRALWKGLRDAQIALSRFSPLHAERARKVLIDNPRPKEEK